MILPRSTSLSSPQVCAWQEECEEILCRKGSGGGSVYTLLLRISSFLVKWYGPSLAPDSIDQLSRCKIAISFSEYRFWRLTSCADNSESQRAISSQQLHLRCLKFDSATCCRIWLGFHVWPMRTVRHCNIICIRIRYFRMVSWQHMFSIAQGQYGAHWISSRVLIQFASILQAQRPVTAPSRKGARAALFVHLTSSAESACVHILDVSHILATICDLQDRFRSELDASICAKCACLLGLHETTLRTVRRTYSHIDVALHGKSDGGMELRDISS